MGILSRGSSMRNRRQITVRSLVFGLIFLAGWILIGFPALSMEWPNRRRAKVDEPNTPTQLARSIDSVEEKILDDGVVVIKEPDVWGQARMTMYRRDIERVLRSALDDTKYFDFIVSARIARVDEASFKSQTALGASLTPLAGGRSGGSSSATTASSAPTVIALPNPTAVMNERDAQMKTANQLLDQADTDGIVRSSPFAYLPSKAPFSNVGQQPGQLGIEPSIFLDEKKRFLDHLNQLRRVNLGDDNSDSAGYGIYLLRMPVSIQPGECTLKGHGAILTATIHHGFGPDFLKETIKNLIINDVVDQISPIVYELIRTGLIEKLDSDFAKRESDRRRFAELKFDAGRKKLDERLMEKQNKKNEYDLKLITLKNQYASIITEAHGKIKFSMQSWFKKEKIDNINIQVVDEMRIAEMLNKSIKDPNFKNDILEVRKIKSQLQAIKRNKEKLIEAVDKLTGSGNFGPNPPVPFVKSLNSDISEIDSTLKRFSENEKLLKSGETLTSIVDKTAKMIPSNLETTIPIVTDLDQLSILNSTGLETYKDIPIDIKKRFSFQLMNDVISGWNSNTAVNDLKKDLSDQLKMLNITNLNSIIDSITNEYKSNIELSIMSSTNLKSQSETTPQRIDSISYLDSITNMIVEILNSLSLNDEKEQCIKNVLIEVNMDKNTINGIIKDIRKTSEDLKKMNNDIYIVKKEIDKLEKSISDSNNKIQEKLSSDLREISQNIADLEKNISLERMANVAFPLTLN